MSLGSVVPLKPFKVKLESGGIRDFDTRAHRITRFRLEHEPSQVDDLVVNGVFHSPCGRAGIEEAELCIGSVDQLRCGPVSVDYCDIRHAQIKIIDIATSREAAQGDEITLKLLCVDTSEDYTAVLAKVG
jgi:hypothetical protein